MLPPSAPWTLLLGPSPRLADLRPALAAIADDRMGPRAPAVRAIDDLLECLSEPASIGRLILDTDAICPEDLGLVRRFLATRPSWEVVLTGLEGGSRSAKGLSASGSAHWYTWPLDVEQLGALALPPAAKQPIAALARDAAPAPLEAAAEAPVEPEPHSPSIGRLQLAELEEDLEAIEQILAHQERDEDGEQDGLELEEDGFEGDGERIDPRDLDLTPEEIEAFLAPDDLETSGPAQAVSAPPRPVVRTEQPLPASSWAPPSWYRDQVADLADRAQRLQLSLSAIQEDPGHLAHLAQDVIGLTQFARTLGFLAAPPGRGHQELALGNLLEELLRGIAGARPDGPRYKIRPDPDVRVQVDKSLLITALDALLQLADTCANKDDVVRVSLETTEEQVTVCLRFPAGPLAEVACAEALAPYALHRVVPTIGPNALSAAGRILQGQGGDLAFGEGNGPDERVILASLPRVP